MKVNHGDTEGTEKSNLSVLCASVVNHCRIFAGLKPSCGGILGTVQAAREARASSTRHRPMQDISGKTAIVTGAASGIGLGIATALAEAGANVVMADIQKDAIEEAAHRLSGTNKRVMPVRIRSEERRVGKEGRSRW